MFYLANDNMSLLFFAYILNLNVTNVNYNNESRNDVHLLNRKLNESVRVFCIVLTTASRHDSCALPVHHTWARHCNRVLFVSDDEHVVLEPLYINSTEKWPKVKSALTYVYNNHYDEADWFLKVQDDNFVILENLRHLLSQYSKDTPIYFGHKQIESNQTYMLGSTGYVLSKEALRRFITIAIHNETICSQAESAYEDFEMGRCLENVGVIAGDSRTADGNNTFLPFDPRACIKGIDPVEHSWYYEKAFYKIDNMTTRLTPHVIAFNHVYPNTMYTLHYLIYQLRIFGQNEFLF